MSGEANTDFLEFLGESPDLGTLVIEGPRIKLSSVTLEYAGEIFNEFTTEIVRFMIPAAPQALEETIEFVELCRTAMASGTEAIMMILSRENDEFLGMCGIHVRGNPKRPELGIWLKKSAHGQKLGLEAIETIIAWARKNVALEGFIYPVDRRNTPSRKIPEHLGGQIIEEKIAIGRGGQILDEVVYLIPA